MKKTIRILLADDHTIVRQGLGRMLEDQPDLKVVGQADNGQIAIEQTGVLKASRMCWLELFVTVVARSRRSLVVGRGRYEETSSRPAQHVGRYVSKRRVLFDEVGARLTPPQQIARR